MSVFQTLLVKGDPQAFAAQMQAQPETIERIMGIAKSKGLISHRWVAGDGEYMAIDQWPDAESFHAFFAEAQAEIGPLMEAAGVTAPPEAKTWSPLEGATDTV